jgi:FixJ family two-component response regulator
VEVFASAEDVLLSGDLQHTACPILDMRMPGMSGVELQRQMAADNPSNPEVHRAICASVAIFIIR